MSKNIFISYKFDDAELVRTLPSWFQRNGGRCEGTPIFVDPTIPPGGTNAIDEKILRTMENCAAVLFVVGDNNHNSPWINREAKIAISLPRPITAVQLEGSTGGLPNELKNLNQQIELLEWGPRNLCDVLNKIQPPAPR